MTLPLFRLQRRFIAAADTLPGLPGRENLRFPLPAPARLAIVDAEFHLAAHMEVFASSDVQGMAAFAPDAMALPLGSALAMADRKLLGLIELPSLKLAIVVFSSVDGIGAGPLAAHHRDLLWKAFGLPVFEQLRGWSGRVVARECEVHDGLHLDAAAVGADFAGFPGEILNVQCDCGLETARLRHRITAGAARVAGSRAAAA